ncbi:hypothetical protein ACLESO_57620 [Pyxidicoccus sp. 3LG]
MLGQRQDDGKSLEPFSPSDPMYPYEIRAGRYLFGDKGTVLTAVGRFEDRKEAEEALKRVEARRPSAHAVITSMGPYLLPEKPTCKVTRKARGKNPAIDAASWILEKEGVLLAGSQTPCTDGKLTKKVTIMSCDGMKNLFTDSVEEVCDRTRSVDTCVYSMEPGVLMLKHEYTIEGATSFYVRVHDVRTKKRLFHLEASYGDGLPGFDPKTDPETRLEDVDQDGVPEIVNILQETGERISVRKWRQRRFVEMRSP